MSIAQSTKEYFEEWHPYDHLIKHNYMRHREIIQSLRGATTLKSSDDVRLLELGCGNAYVAYQAFCHLDRVQFTGIDLSSQALKEAEENLRRTSWDIDLIEGDIERRLGDLNGSFDLVVAGYSLHHYSSEAILRILQEVRQKMKEAAEVFVYDVATRENETREAFNDRLVAGIEFKQVGISADHLASITHHITNHDFPISISQWDQLVKEAGFTSLECIYRDEEEYYALFRII